jgi:hypothetical protein
MGYLPDFDYDVFISYAHKDDDQYPREDKGWVAQLHSALEERIGTYLHSEPALWRDCELSGNDDFSRKISNRLANAATLLSIITENFLSHKWFQTELEGFCRNAEDKVGLRVGEKLRIFKVLRSDVKRAALPPQFDGTDRYKFFGPDPDHPRSIHEFRCSLGEKQFNLWWTEMDRLAKDIADTLKAMRNMSSGYAPGQVHSASPSLLVTVYLAQTSEDQEFTRSKIKKELQDRNIAVLPQGDLPFRGSQFERQVRDDLKNSDLSIHIFGNLPGFTPEGRERASTFIQHDLALERAQERDFRRFVWTPVELDSSDERQRQYLDYLKTDTSVQQGAEILQGKVEELKTEVLRSIDQIRRQREERSRTVTAEIGPAPAPTRVTASNDPLSVYIICDVQDLQSPGLVAINNFLLDSGCEPIKPVMVDSAEESRRMHEEYLRICDAFIIYYGAGSEGWVSTKIADIVRFRNTRRSPFLSKAVYIAPPVTDAKNSLRTLQARVILGGSDFAADQLSPFLDPLRRR